MFIYNASSHENELNLMRRDSFSDAGFQKYQKKTRKEHSLQEIIISWKELTATIEPCYSKPESAGRRPIGSGRMLLKHFAQHRFNLSNPAAEEAVYDSRSLRQFVGIDLQRESMPEKSWSASSAT